jgi:hypothetical protein
MNKFHSDVPQILGAVLQGVLAFGIYAPFVRDSQVKVKVTLEQAKKAQKWSIGITLLFL